ncbi:MAG: hypothetical protein HQL05_14605 [Nitrospirae bacterium]|uniref:hypothetical protein n=1 Tax=Candidatus Magnetobacterium casense TaxID=1455061 RepID=UPI0012DC8A9C|nr:hypothetical protein [Candidatus Magnetobacterium casensis]MBF0339046.1 hypothetical protein [Nitrospirota bacterium]
MKIVTETEKEKKVTAIKNPGKRQDILNRIYKHYNVTLPDDYKLNRNEIHER